ncbi:MAG: tRNA pseudouridine(55) synthase TruB [Candidatus Saccharibacteria bacterium]|nr:tRNA pseudouridine(55) synthase TruB [Candidatus Saccharibacteria bacterium]
MEDQIILVDKPAGISSFGVVAKVRGFLKAKFGHKVKVGHTGTLDPFATGLLIILSGKMTKKSNEFLKLDKEYEATLKLGFVSNTGDVEGELTKVRDDLVPTRDEIEIAVKSFVGVISQTPPKYSAIKINGVRAYKLARKNQDFEIPSREVTIYDIEIMSYKYPELSLRCKVSSGTYIRTLAEDIGKKIGTGAYLTALRRTQVGKYSVTDAAKLEQFKQR